VLEAFHAAGGQATASASGEFIDLAVVRRAAEIAAGQRTGLGFAGSSGKVITVHVRRDLSLRSARRGTTSVM
jgi:hypothetical protein